MSRGDNRRRRYDSQTPLTIRSDVFILQLQLQFAIDDRFANGFRGYLHETHTKNLLEDRVSEWPHYPAECQGNTAQA